MKRGPEWFLLLVLGVLSCGRPAPHDMGDAMRAVSEGGALPSPKDPAPAVLTVPPIPAVPAVSLDRETASRSIALSLACVDREYPNKPDNVLDSAAALRPSRVNSPAFFGCYDWHSAVHGHWAMVRVLGMFPDLPEAAAVRAVLDRHLSPGNLSTELAFFQRNRARCWSVPTAGGGSSGWRPSCTAHACERLEPGRHPYSPSRRSSRARWRTTSRS